MGPAPFVVPHGTSFIIIILARLIGSFSYQWEVESFLVGNYYKTTMSTLDFWAEE